MSFYQRPDLLLLATSSRLWSVDRECVAPNVLFGSSRIRLLYDSAQDEGALVDSGICEAWVLGSSPIVDGLQESHFGS